MLNLNNIETQVLIIGGGVTGTGILRDLSLRGIKCLLVESDDINRGASGANHGLLHSGARYVTTDPESATECGEENVILKKTLGNCIEDNGGLYVAVKGDDENYVADFPDQCEKCGIKTQEIDIKQVQELESAVTKDIFKAYQTKDATIDPFGISLSNIAQARSLEGTTLIYNRVVKLKKLGGKIISAILKNTKTGGLTEVFADYIVNAAGAWVGEIAALAGMKVKVVYSKGSLLVTASRITRKSIMRLRAPSIVDALVPGGTISIIGPTSVRVNSLNDIAPTIAEVEDIINEGIKLIPQLNDTRYIRAFSGVRPIIDSSEKGSDNALSRGYDLIDHEKDGLNNFITIAGGKLSIYRLMAEKTSDLICQKLGISNPCLTRTNILPKADDTKWTDPGATSKLWFSGRSGDPDNTLLCECEMVPVSVVDSIVESIEKNGLVPNHKTIEIRSRIGKGSCQGTICGSRIAAYLSEKKGLNGSDTQKSLKEFLRKRWKGEHAILANNQMAQAELKEALYINLLGTSD
jgi:glycerol-3-phosphate dehydrogenase